MIKTAQSTHKTLESRVQGNLHSIPKQLACFKRDKNDFFYDESKDIWYEGIITNGEIGYKLYLGPIPFQFPLEKIKEINKDKKINIPLSKMYYLCRDGTWADNTFKQIALDLGKYLDGLFLKELNEAKKAINS